MQIQTMDNTTMTAEQLRKQQLKDRITAIKKHLPAKWRKRFVEVYPQYDNRLDQIRLSNIMSLRGVDEAMTTKLEQIFFPVVHAVLGLPQSGKTKRAKELAGGNSFQWYTWDPEGVTIDQHVKTLIVDQVPNVEAVEVLINLNIHFWNKKLIIISNDIQNSELNVLDNLARFIYV